MKRQRGSMLIVYIVAALALVLAIGTGVRTIYNAGAASKQAEWDEANRQQRKDEMEKANAAAIGLETGNEKAKIVYRTITKTVDKYIDRPVYRNVCFDTDGLRDVNAALIGALTPAAEPREPMPKPDAAR